MLIILKVYVINIVNLLISDLRDNWLIKLNSKDIKGIAFSWFECQSIGIIELFTFLAKVEVVLVFYV